MICIVTHCVKILTLLCLSCLSIVAIFHLGWLTLSVCLCGYKRNLSSNWCACSGIPFHLLSVHNPVLLQASSLPLWSSAWASIPPVCSGALSAVRKEPACCMTTWPTGTCTSASPSSSSRQPSSSTPPRGSVWERTTGNTSRTARVTSHPPNSLPPMWLWTIWAKRSPRTQPTGQSSYTTWRTTRCATTWSQFYSGGLHWDCRLELRLLMCNWSDVSLVSYQFRRMFSVRVLSSFTQTSNITIKMKKSFTKWSISISHLMFFFLLNYRWSGPEKKS